MKNKNHSMFLIHSSKHRQRGVLATTSFALLAASTAWATDLTWDDGDSTGNWNTTDYNWTSAQWSNSNPDSASFDNRNEVLSLTEAITANHVAFRAGGTESGGHLLTLTGSSLAATSVTVRGEALGGVVNGVGECNAQRLKLSGINVTAGVVSVGRSSLEIEAAMLNVTGQIVSSSDWANLVLGSGAVVTATSGLDFTAAGVIASNLDFNGGTFTTPFIYGCNLYGSSVNFNGTTVVASADTGEFLRISGGGTSPALLRSGGLIFDSNGKTVTLANPLCNFAAEVGFLTKQGAGTLILTGASNYSGATAVNQGTLQIGNGAAGATIAGTSGVSIASGATLAFNDGDDLIFSRNISGAGGLLKNGSGTLTLGATNNYSGTTTIQAGTLKLTKTVLAEDFTVSGTTDTTHLNFNLAGRQVSLSTSQNWTGFNNQPYGTQVGNTTDVGQPTPASNGNFLLLYSTGKAALTTFVLNSTTVTAPLLISFDMFNGTNSGDWTSFTQTTPVPSAGWNYGGSDGGFPVVGAVGEFGFRRLQDGSGVLNVGGVGDFSFASSTNHFSFLLTDTAGTGSAFNGNGSVLTLKNGATTIASTALPQMTTSHITFAANVGQIGGVDNLAISSPGTNVLNPATDVVLAASSAALTLDQVDQTIASLSGPAGSTVNLDFHSTLRVSGSTSTTFAGVVTGASGSIVKGGSGTLALTGTNSYTGNTTVSAGTLSVGNGTSNSSLADDSTIAIASGAVMDLNFSGANPDTVKKLYLGTPAVRVPAGTYNSSTPTYGSYFTGTGSLVVTTGGAYDTWMALYPVLVGADQMPTADPDQDGLSNQQEFAFGLIPNHGSSVNPIRVQLDKTTGIFIYQRRASSGLTYRILTSTDLVFWSEDTGASASQSAGVIDGDGNQEVTVTLSGSKPLTMAKLFVRVAAE